MLQYAESDLKQYSLTPQTLDKEDPEPSTQQESDGRIILYVADLARQGCHKIRGIPFHFQGAGRLMYFLNKKIGAVMYALFLTLSASHRVGSKLIIYRS